MVDLEKINPELNEVKKKEFEMNNEQFGVVK